LNFSEILFNDGFIRFDRLFDTKSFVSSCHVLFNNQNHHQKSFSINHDPGVSSSKSVLNLLLVSAQADQEAVNALYALSHSVQISSRTFDTTSTVLVTAFCTLSSTGASKNSCTLSTVFSTKFQTESAA
jgi:hypothetical protein